MDLSIPLDISRDARHLDDSGTPVGLIELIRRRGDLAVVDEGLRVLERLGDGLGDRGRDFDPALRECQRFDSFRAAAEDDG